MNVKSRGSGTRRAVAQLGSGDPTTALAGVYALANLADSWAEQHQQCVDVLCARLRLTWEPHLDPDHPIAAQTIEHTSALVPNLKATYVYPNQAGELGVRRTILRVIGEHLRPPAPHLRAVDPDPRPAPAPAAIRTSGSMVAARLDFTGATLPELDWSPAVIPSVGRFDGATFSGDARSSLLSVIHGQLLMYFLRITPGGAHF